MSLAVRPVVQTLEDRSTPATFFVDPTLSAVNQTFNAGQPNSQTVTFGVNGFDNIVDALVTAQASPGADDIVLSNSGHLLDNSPGTIFFDSANPISITAGAGAGFTGEAVITPTDSTADDLTAVLQADGAGAVLNLTNLTLDGDGDNIDVGRFVQYTNGAVGSISSVVFQDVVFLAPPNNNPGIPLTVQTGSAVTVFSSSFNNYGNAGISISDSDALIQLNTFTGGGEFADAIQYGVQIANIASNSSDVILNANTFIGFTGTDGTVFSAGVFVYNETGTSPNVQAFGNTFTDNQIGVLVDSLDASGVDSSGVVLFANNFTGGIDPAITATSSDAGQVSAANNFFGGGEPGLDAPNGISDFVDTNGTFLTTPAPDTTAANGPQYTLQTGIASNGLILAPLTLIDGNVGQSYSQQVAATGPNGPFTYAVTSGILPAGLTLNATTGAISGTPTGPVASAVFNITATSSIGDTVTVAYRINVGESFPLVIVTTTLPDAVINQPYSQQIVADDGLAPYSYAVTAGSLPAGLTLDPTTGIISGTPPLAVPPSTFTITVTDSEGTSVSQQYTVGVLSLQPILPDQYAAGQDVGGGQVNIYGLSGTPPQATATPFGAGYTAGVRTAIADVTGDGESDLIVASGPGVPVSIQVLDGITGAVVATLNPFELGFLGGAYVAAGDIDGDGIAEIVVTPDQSGGPRVVVYAGGSFTQIASFFGIDDPNFRGGARAAVADINGDGFGDIIVAAGFGGGPRVAVFNGTTITSGSPAKLFNDFFAFAPDTRDGIYVAGGDVNADGYAELITRAGEGGGPRVQVLSGYQALVAGGIDLLTNSSNLVLTSFFAGDPASRDGVRVAAKNLDEDTFVDIVTGAGPGTGSLTNTYLGNSLLSGATTPNTTFEAFPGFTGGVFVG